MKLEAAALKETCASALHEPQGRASSPLRADGCNHDFLRREERRALSDAPYLIPPVHGPDARPILEVEALHEPENRFVDFQRLAQLRFMVPMRPRKRMGALPEPENCFVDFQRLRQLRFMGGEEVRKEHGALHEPFIRKRQTAAALQDASEGHVLPGFREVLDCASPLALWLSLQKWVHGTEARPILEVEALYEP
jgi:hypothetical protein